MRPIIPAERHTAFLWELEQTKTALDAERAKVRELDAQLADARGENTPSYPREFYCRSCSTTWGEDDLQQVQPDGRYACPLEACGMDTLKVDRLRSPWTGRTE